jgi:MFS family permease
LFCGWGGNQFTPLLVRYREAGYAPLTVDVLLGAYVLGLVPGLLLAGGLSDRFGRKPLMLTGTTLSILSSALMAVGRDSTALLGFGRFVAGLAVAAAMSVGSTWMKELSDVAPGADPELGTRRGALWLTIGFGVGAGVAGSLAQWCRWPMVLPYLVHVCLTAAALLVLLRCPETVHRGAESDRAAAGRFGAVRHPRFRRVIVPMAPWIFGSAGVAYAIMPQLVGGRVGSWGLAYSTLLTVCTLTAGTLVQPLASRLDRTASARGVITAMIIMSVGLVTSATAVALSSPLLALGAAVVLGAAYGTAVVSGLLELRRLARPEEIAGLTGAYYALAYSGFLLPSLLAVLSSTVSYPLLLVCLAMVAGIGTLVVVRHSRAHLPAAI